MDALQYIEQYWHNVGITVGGPADDAGVGSSWVADADPNEDVGAGWDEEVVGAGSNNGGDL